MSSLLRIETDAIAGMKSWTAYSASNKDQQDVKNSKYHGCFGGKQ
ncbi:hypothetical protein DFR42_1011024 [Undibacterium pigrum]|uniref:Uncharacterized protein n=1 Tax=Undibacterium pigrum TaxID=401470 RepID=A0A318JI31_9BURK|nr:hypothetical protein DFR42_1011024 [Undibacterium pigrum]